MEQLRAQCAAVGKPVNILPFITNASLAFIEANLPATKGNAYSLGGTFRKRIQCDPQVLRAAWAHACQLSTGSELLNGSPFFPLLELEEAGKYGALTSQLKGCYDPASSAKARVALDIDGLDDSKPFPTPSHLHAAACDMLQRNTDAAYDMGKERAVLFFLSTPSKPRSVHLYFVDLCFAQTEANVLGKAHTLTGIFDALLADYGMQGDFSICNSGLRFPFGNKFPPNKNNGRDAVGVPFFFNFEDVDGLTFDALSSLIDPRCYVFDDAFNRELVWKSAPVAAPAPAQRQAVGVAEPTRTLLANVQPSESALLTHLPELIGVNMHRINQPGGVVKLVPQTTWCPFKVTPSSDHPAHHHSCAKLYAFTYPHGGAVLFCGVCTGKRIVVDGNTSAEDVVQERVINEFNGRYARCGAYNVLRYGMELPSGSFSEPQLMSYAQFCNAAANLNPAIKINKRNFKEPEFWYSSNNSKRFVLGMRFDPSYKLDGNYFNTYTGINPAVLAKVESVGIDQWQRTRSLIENNICGGDVQAAKAFIGFFVDLVRNPGVKPGFGICIFGPQGCGKGLATQFFAKIVGDNHSCTLDNTSLEGQFNYRMMQSTLVIAEEAVAAGNERTVSLLKSYVTESKLPVRRKYQDETEADTFMRIVMLSNSDAPVRIEDRDRRWLVLNAGYNMGNDDDVAWRSKIEDIVGERESLIGCASFVKYAMQCDNSQFDARLPIRTQARWQVRFSRFNEYERFIYSALCTGVLCNQMTDDSDGCHLQLSKQYQCEVAGLGALAFARPMPKRMMYIGLMETTRNDKVNESGLWKMLLQILPEEQWNFSRSQVGQSRCRMMRVPPRADLQKAFCVKLGQPLEIFSTWLLE